MEIKAVEFEDSSLESAIKKQLNINEDNILTKEIAKSVTSLDLSNSNINSIKGLEEFSSLTSLNLRQNKISDLTPLANLSKLTMLNLDCNHIGDISPLKKLTNLKDIHLNYQCITYKNICCDDILVLANPLVNIDKTPIKAIKDINYSGKFNENDNTIVWLDITKDIQINCKFNVWVNIGNVKTGFSGAIAGNTILGGIEFKDKDFKRLLYKALNKNDDYIMRREEAKNIKYLNLSRAFFRGDYYIKSIEDLKYFPDLISLSLECQYEISNFDILEKLTNLEVLNLERASIRDITPLSKLNKLRNLDFLSNLKNLKVLLLKDDRHLSDISPIKNLTNLKYLSLEGSLPDISSLSSLKNLEYLNLGLEDYWGDSLDWKWKLDIDCLKGLDNLKELHLNRTEIHDYSSLKGLTNLKLLSLNRSCIGSNLNESIKELKNLDTLELKSCNLNDIECLKDLTNVKKLGIAYNIVTDISPISTMIGLEELDISGNKGQNRSLKDIKALELCNNLKVLRCTTTEDIPKEQFDSLQKVNPNLKIDKHALQKW